MWQVDLKVALMRMVTAEHQAVGRWPVCPGNRDRRHKAAVPMRCAAVTKEFCAGVSGPVQHETDANTNVPLSRQAGAKGTT